MDNIYICKTNDMKEIDQMLDQWIYNSIIRAEIRKIIIKELNNKQDE